jgi:hypothetical protein
MAQVMRESCGGTVLMSNTITTDILFAADHFIMVTTIETIYSPDHRDIENAAWERLADEYGVDWVNMTKPFIKQVSIEVVKQTDIDEVNK